MMMLSYILIAVFGFYLGRFIFNDTVMHGPDSNIIKKNVYKHFDRCYSYTLVPYICPL